MQNLVAVILKGIEIAYPHQPFQTSPRMQDKIEKVTLGFAGLEEYSWTIMPRNTPDLNLVQTLAWLLFRNLSAVEL